MKILFFTYLQSPQSIVKTKVDYIWEIRKDFLRGQFKLSFTNSDINFTIAIN